MSRIRIRVLGLVAVAAIVGACSGTSASATPVPTAPPSAAATPAATPAASTAASASASAAAVASPSAAASPIASLAADQLTQAGKLIICSDIPYPPQEFFDAKGNPTGSDIDLGAEIAKRLGLQMEVQNSVFDTIILALTGGKCDIIMSAQNITTDRLKQVNMIPFFQAGQAFLVQKGNPKGIKTVDDLCGKSVGAETGTTEVDALNGTPKSDYAGKGLSQQCVKNGKAAITVKTFAKDSDALLALQSGQVDCYFSDSPVAGYYVVQHPDQFELAGLTLNVALEGISVPKDKTGLKDAVTAALKSMITDGTYMQILQKYGDQSGAITIDQVK